jgi:hypothetical protein
MRKQKGRLATLVQVLEYMDGPQAVLLERVQIRRLLVSQSKRRDSSIRFLALIFLMINGSATSAGSSISDTYFCFRDGKNGSSSI